MPTRGERNVDEAGLHRLPAHIVGQANRLHLVMLVLTLLMVPGALRALEPIDMEAYDMESPELNAQTTIDETFASSEVIVAFLVTGRDPVHIDLEENVPRASTSDGQPDSTTFPQVTEIIESGEPWGGIDAPAGGILNLTLLREIDAKADLIRNHPINTTLKPLVNDVTGAQTDGVMTLPDIFRAFMANESILTRSSKDAFGNDVPPATDWSDCGELECFVFDDVNLTQDHIDLASQRLVEASDNTFLRWLSLDRGFRADMNAVSSRSHTVIRVVIESRKIGAGKKGKVRVSTLNMVDLAGSERMSQAKTRGTRLKEGININTSLLTLGTVIKKLMAQGAAAATGRKRRKEHIPYRNSMLTGVLAKSLGGSAQTAVVPSCSAAPIGRAQSSSSGRPMTRSSPPSSSHNFCHIITLAGFWS